MALACDKSEAVDGVQAELMQLLNESNQEWVTAEIWKWWATNTAQKRNTRARVVSI